jgi:uncharacterized surface protein with fasciclin (FAS1) repeats
MTRTISIRFGSAALAAALVLSGPSAFACGEGTSKDAGLKVMNAAYGGQEKASKDIVDTAVAAGNFKTLATALAAAGLVETLKGDGPFTVFAPTDEAFAKLPKGTVENLLKDPKKLAKVLTYHVVAGKVTAADVAALTSAKTVEGSSVKIDTRAGVRINDARVTTADIMAANGVIHVIDTVLLPPA